MITNTSGNNIKLKDSGSLRITSNGIELISFASSSAGDVLGAADNVFMRLGGESLRSGLQTTGSLMYAVVGGAVQTIFQKGSILFSSNTGSADKNIAAAQITGSIISGSTSITTGILTGTQITGSIISGSTSVTTGTVTAAELNGLERAVYSTGTDGSITNKGVTYTKGTNFIIFYDNGLGSKFYHYIDMTTTDEPAVWHYSATEP